MVKFTLIDQETFLAMPLVPAWVGNGSAHHLMRPVKVYLLPAAA